MQVFFQVSILLCAVSCRAHKLKIEFWKKRDLEKSQAEPAYRLRLTAAGETSLDLDLVAMGKDLLPLGQNELQHPVLIGGPDGVLLDAVQGEGPGEAAGAALPADVVVGRAVRSSAWCLAEMVSTPSFTSRSMSSLRKPGRSAWSR